MPEIMPDIIQTLRREFYSFRNGPLADTLRKAGMPHKVIFGLQLPQLTGIYNAVLAPLSPESRIAAGWELWADRNCREARLLACRALNPEALTTDEALQMMSDVQTREEADILAFWLLKKVKPEIQQEILRKASAAGLSESYALEALKRNLQQ